METKEFGDAGKHVIVEEGLSGPEISYMVLTDGEKFVPLAPSRDYKRAFDGDAGPNTGGMGAISSDDLISREVETRIQEKVVRPDDFFLNPRFDFSGDQIVARNCPHSPSIWPCISVESPLIVAGRGERNKFLAVCQHHVRYFWPGQPFFDDHVLAGVAELLCFHESLDKRGSLIRRRCY